MAAERTFDYHVKDWQPEIRLFPDLIPIVGMFTMLDRMRRDQGLSLKDELGSFVRDLRNPRMLLSMGTENWPKSSDNVAYLRSCMMAARNAIFPGYHAVASFEALVNGPQVVRSIVALIQG